MSLVAFTGAVVNPSVDDKHLHQSIFQYEYFSQHHISLSQIGLTNFQAFFLTTQGLLYYLPLASLTLYLKKLRFCKSNNSKEALEVPTPILLPQNEDEKPYKWKLLRCTAEYAVVLSQDGFHCQIISSENLLRNNLFSLVRQYSLFCPSTFKEPFLDLYISTSHIALRSKEFILLFELKQLFPSPQPQTNYYFYVPRGFLPTCYDNATLQIENVLLGNNIAFFIRQNGTVHVMAYENWYGITGVKQFTSKVLQFNPTKKPISDLSLVTSQVTDFHLLPDEQITHGAVSNTSTHFVSNLGRVFVCGKDFIGLVMGEDLLDEPTPCIDRYWSHISQLHVTMSNETSCTALRKEFLCVGLNDQGQLFAYGNDSHSTFVSQQKSSRENWIIPKLLHFEHCIVKQFHLQTQSMIVLWEPNIPYQKLSKYFDHANSLSDLQWNQWYLHKCILHVRCPYLLLLLQQTMLNTYLEAMQEKVNVNIEWKSISNWQSTYSTRNTNLIDTQVWYCLLQYLYTDTIKETESFTAKQWNQLLWISELFDMLQSQFVPLTEEDYQTKMISILQKSLTNSLHSRKNVSKSSLTSMSKCVVYCQEQLALSTQTLVNSDCTTFSLNISQLWKNSCFADLELVFDKNKIMVHKYILACQVDYFDALFVQSPFIESQQSSLNMNQHEEELTWKGLLYILEYLYCSHVTHIDQSNVLYVLLQSGFLQCTSLQQECERLAIPYLDQSNVFKVLALSEAYQANILLDGCYRWIVDRWEVMYSSKEYENEVTEQCKYILETMARGEGKKMEKKIVKQQEEQREDIVETISSVIATTTFISATAAPRPPPRAGWLKRVKNWFHSQVHKDQSKDDLKNLEQF